MKTPQKKKRKPVLTYRILSIPVDGDGTPCSFASPKSVTDLFERKARKLGRSLEEYLLEVLDRDLKLKRTITVSLDEIERAHALWKEEFEEVRHLKESFRIVIDVPAEYANYLKKKLLLRGTSIGEHIMNRINRSLLDGEVQAEEPELSGRRRKGLPPQICAIAATLALSVTPLLPTIYDSCA